jgi:hypothetical protein
MWVRSHDAKEPKHLELAVVSFLINHQDNTVINNLSRCVIHGPGSKSGMSRRRRHESRGNLVRCHASGSEYQGSWVVMVSLFRGGPIQERPIGVLAYG